MRLDQVRDGWRIAIEQLRANKLRSALTVLGVVIGIATVMAMASIVAGFREQIVNTLEVVGPTTFRVLRYFSTTGVNPDAVPREVRIRPKLVPQDAEAIARLPEIHYAAIWTQLFQRFEYGGNHTRILGVFGADDRFMEILGGGIIAGRSFTAAELRGGAPVVIVEQRTVDRLFGAVNPLGRIVRIGGHPFKILAVWQGEVSRVIAALHERQAELGLPEQDEAETSPRQVVSKTWTYLENHQDKMQYDAYRKDGLPITSSLMESAVKQINQRVKGSEKFWSEEGSEAVLQLRADQLSDGEPLAAFWQRRQAAATGQRRYRRTG